MEDRWSDSTSFNLPFFQLLGFEPSNGSKSTNQERYNARACSCKLLFILSFSSILSSIAPRTEAIFFCSENRTRNLDLYITHCGARDFFEGGATTEIFDSILVIPQEVVKEQVIGPLIGYNTLEALIST